MDCPARRTVLLLFVVMMASALDALFTLLFLQSGGDEANPFMSFAIDQGNMPFVALKMVLTGVGVWFLAAHQNFALAYKGLHVLALAYVILLGIHMAILLS